MRVRMHGERGPPVFLIHGGPGVPGHMAPVARLLKDRWRAVEPLQRLSGGAPLTVQVHLEDLDACVAEHADGPAALVGASWGAMLALAYAAEHPGKVDRVVLIGCGTFDPLARALLLRSRRQRIPEAVRRELEEQAAQLEAEHDPARQNELFRAWGARLFPYYSYDPEILDLEIETFDYRGHRETWEDMLRLEREGTYPARFSRIDAPVLMLHGDHDPHPGEAIYKSLQRHVRDLAHHPLARCGHFPWLERHARAEFTAALRAALPA